MAKPLFPKGIIQIVDRGTVYTAEYMGRQEHFECCVCRKGGNCYTFNIIESQEQYDKGDYQTFGYGREHLPTLYKAPQSKRMNRPIHWYYVNVFNGKEEVMSYGDDGEYTQEESFELIKKRYPNCRIATDEDLDRLL